MSGSFGQRLASVIHFGRAVAFCAPFILLCLGIGDIPVAGASQISLTDAGGPNNITIRYTASPGEQNQVTAEAVGGVVSGGITGGAEYTFTDPGATIEAGANLSGCHITLVDAHQASVGCPADRGIVSVDFSLGDLNDESLATNVVKAVHDGGYGDDVYHSGTGADTFAVNDPIYDGTDTVSYELRASPVTVDLTDGSRTNEGAAGENDTFTLNAVQKVIGTAGDDTLLGSNELMIDGGPGADLMGGTGLYLGVAYEGRASGVSVTQDGVANDGEPGEGDNVQATVSQMIGTDHDDQFVGSSVANQFFADPGADYYEGGGGTDEVSYRDRTEPLTISLDDEANDGAADEGDDVRSDIEKLTSGAGDDEIIGSPGPDEIATGSGDDVIRAGDGDDSILAARGDDTVFGGPGDDYLHTFDGADELNGEAGEDELSSGAGADTLRGGTEDDSLSAGSGDDLIDEGTEANGADTLSGGENVDTVSYEGRSNPVRMLRPSGTYGEVNEGDSVSGTERWKGGSGDDQMDLDSSSQYPGQYYGGAGDDDIRSGEGPDLLVGGPGEDYLQGRAGADTFNSRDDAADSVNCGTSPDTVIADTRDTLTSDCETREVGPPAVDVAPLITGIPQAAQTLTSSTGDWLGTSPFSYAYAWERCDSAGSNCAVVSGETGPSLDLDSGDIGHRFRSLVSATNVGGTTVGLSALTGIVEEVDEVAPETSITGTPDSPTQQETVEFAFTSTDAGATFLCRVDDDPWDPCESPASVTVSLDGLHTFEVKAVDDVGNEDPTPASAEWTLDRDPPDTEISSLGDNVSDPTQIFTFAAEPGATYECRLDQEAWESCESPVSRTVSQQGPHDFQVRATDLAGNLEEPPASRPFVYDSTPPDTTILAGPPSRTADSSPEITFGATDHTGFECQLDGGAWAECESPFPLAGLTDGTHTFRVRAFDAATNRDPSPAATTFTVDTAAPGVQIDSGPAGPTNEASPLFAFTSEPNASFTCRVDSGPWNACSAPHRVGPLARGAHRFEVRATDDVGNTGSLPAGRNFTVDLDAPDTRITAGPSDTTSPPSPTFSFASTEGPASFECQLDGGAWTRCAAPWKYSDLDAGSHSFQVRSTDSAGNTDRTPATAFFEVVDGAGPDVTAPSTTVTKRPPAKLRTAKKKVPVLIRFRSEPGATFQCRIDRGRYKRCASPLRKTMTSRRGSGVRHTVLVRAIDGAGNVEKTPERITVLVIRK